MLFKNFLFEIDLFNTVIYLINIMNILANIIFCIIFIKIDLIKLNGERIDKLEKILDVILKFLKVLIYVVVIWSQTKGWGRVWAMCQAENLGGIAEDGSGGCGFGQVETHVQINKVILTRNFPYGFLLWGNFWLWAFLAQI